MTMPHIVHSSPYLSRLWSLMKIPSQFLSNTAWQKCRNIHGEKRIKDIFMECFKFKFSKVQFIRNWNSVYHWETGGASDVAWQLWILLCRFQRFLIPWLLVSSREYDDMISMILSCKIWQYLWWFFVRRSCFCFVFANDNFTKKKQENCPNQIMVFLFEHVSYK